MSSSADRPSSAFAGSADEQVIQLTSDPITSHSWNKDRSQIAICPNNEEIHIYKLTASSWEKVHTLRQHDHLVTAIDWAPETNKIVTTSQDRNAYVWEYSDNKWNPTLVILKINRAATYVKWSPDENKFAVATGAKVVAICYFDAENNWWISKHLKRIAKSTVLALDWHPNNILLAVGAADMRVRVYSAFITKVDKKCPANAWGDKFPFETFCGEFGNPGIGWIHSVAFSPDGETLALAAHNSSLSFVDPKNKENPLQMIKFPFLPLKSILYLTESNIVGVGYDCTPLLFSCDEKGIWRFNDKLEQKKRKTVGTATAMNKFKQLDTRAQAEGGDVGLDTIHQNTISDINVYSGKRGKVERFSTSGVDGRVVIWENKK